MKKVVGTVVLGSALLATSGVANAEQRREVEPRWGIHSERSTTSAPLDFARWLARRLNDGIAIPVPFPVVPDPKSTPVNDPGPSDGDVVCPLDRAHCPMG